MTNVGALKNEQIDGPLFETLDVKEAAILHKYLTAISNMYMMEHAETKATVPLLKIQRIRLKMVEKFGNAVIIKAISVRSAVIDMF